MTDSTLALPAAPPRDLIVIAATVLSALTTLGVNALLLLMTSGSEGFGALFMLMSIIPVNLVLLVVLLLGTLLVKYARQGGSLAPYVLTSALLPFVAAVVDFALISLMNLKTSGC